MALHKRVTQHESASELDINPVYFREKSCEIPRFKLPEHGVLPRTALQIVRDELILDGNARLNLATFVTTWMEPEAEALCDENTIGVVVILGSTMDGSYEPVAAVNSALDTLQAAQGVDVPIHVDGASGAFVAPFLQPDLVWDFRVPRVASINAS